MQIGCLGWGSLVWNPGVLPIRGKWFEDGPLLPIEFARRSRDGRITLVIVKDRPVVRTLWAILTSDNVQAAKKSLASREGIKDENIGKHIGFWTDGGSNGECVDIISEWAKSHQLTAVVWTNLPPKFNGQENKAPTVGEVIQYLKDLRPIEKRRLAEEYISKAPPQVDTEYRREIKLQLNWLKERTAACA